MSAIETSQPLQSLQPPQPPVSPSLALPFLLQLASPALPVGAYSYSEGLEYLVEQGIITTDVALADWIGQELSYGAMRLEAAAMVRMYRVMAEQEIESIGHWNRWLSAIRETKELRDQSWQMGQTLVRLMGTLEPTLVPTLESVGKPCNFATVFAISSVHWGIALEDALLGYLHSWMTNLVNAGIKLIPLGQTAGQRLLVHLYPRLAQTVQQCVELADDDLYSCSWGAAIASMNHETLYSRLFRS